jgi:hypothetical protein
MKAKNLHSGINITTYFLGRILPFKKPPGNHCNNSSTINLYQGHNVPGLAHGKMYKRATFEILPLCSGVAGDCENH